MSIDVSDSQTVQLNVTDLLGFLPKKHPISHIILLSVHSLLYSSWPTLIPYSETFLLNFLV